MITGRVIPAKGIWLWLFNRLGINLGKRNNQTEKLATTLDWETYWICSEFYLTVSRAGPQSAKVDAEIMYKQLGGVWRPVGAELSIEEGVTGYMHDEMRPYVIIPTNSDVAMVGQSSVANTIVSGYINGWLAKRIRSV